MIDPRPNPPPGHPRPPRVPFPSLHPAERIRGAGILEELPPDYGSLLWESYRNVGDWAIRPRAKRSAGIFGAGVVERRREQLAAVAWIAPELRSALEVVLELLAGPGEMDEARVARACRQVSSWAGERGALATQFYFAAAAGLCTPDDAGQAYAAGKLAREIAKWDAAEVWLEHAMTTARRQKDRETQSMAVLTLGTLCYRQGLYKKAREAYAAALVLARRHRFPDVEGGALHELFIVLTEMQEHVRAEECAHLAVVAYGPGNERLKALAHDVAFTWLSRGYAARALPVLEALLPTLQLSQHRIHVLASVARAAAVCGDRDRFEEAWSQVWELAEEPTVRTRLGPALLELACGAASLKDQTRAVRAVERSLEIAKERGEIDVITRAEALLDTIQRGSFVSELSSDEVSPRQAKSTERLVEELVCSLSRVAAT